MSLRSRIVSLTGLVLLASVVLGAALAGYHAKRALGEELRAGMTGAQRSVRGVVEELSHSPDRARALTQLIATFDGDRHVQATLYSPAGAVIAQSSIPAESDPAPAWFAAMMGPPPASVRIQAAARGICCIELTPTGRSDAAALWSEFSAVVGALLVASGAGLALVYLAIGAALRPLNALSDAFREIGSGAYGRRVPERGPQELLRLERDFNGMSEQLAAMSGKNNALERQLATLQEEERAEIARDLHDEIGPYLFAVNVDAQMVGQLLAENRSGDIPDQVASIRASVSHMQRQIRDILSRLRPAKATELGFNAAINDLIAFWRTRRPDVEFDVALPDQDQPIGEGVGEVAYRIMQEALSNAFRHAACQMIRIRIASGAAHDLIVDVTNDGAAEAPRNASGLGLIGMRERVLSLGGELEIAAKDGSWCVQARLPGERALAQPRSAA